jgi:hypothetical protein
MNRLLLAAAGIAEWLFDRIAPIDAPFDDPAMHSFGPENHPLTPSARLRWVRTLRARNTG